jgi:hypothetical protein
LPNVPHKTETDGKTVDKDIPLASLLALKDLLIICLERLWLYMERGILMFQAKWLDSEIKYIDKRIVDLEKKDPKD